MEVSSPFSRYFETNDIPSEEEIPKIKAIIKSHQVIIDDIEKQIRELDDRRRFHRKAIERHSALLSPIKHVPTDILSSIFLACLPQCHSTIQGMPMSKRHPAVVISHVCHQWRKVALECPLLWAIMRIEMPSPPRLRYTERPRSVVAGPVADLYKAELTHHNKKVQAIKDMTVEWIVRSANCPLDITFSQFEDPPSENPSGDSSHDFAISSLPQPLTLSLTPVLIDLLLSVANRWKRANFRVSITSRNSPLVRLLETPPAKVSQLENLQLLLNLRHPFSVEGQSFRDRISRSIGLLQAPHLQALSLGRVWEPSDQLPVNFGVLTELHLGPYFDPGGTDNFATAFDRIFTVLKKCRNLVRCAINLNPGSRFGIPQAFGTGNTISIPLPLDEKITLPYLKFLSIDGAFLPNGFASSFILPSLRTLAILCRSAIPQNENESGLVDWVRSFGATLTEITFEHANLTESALFYCLERLPNIVTLRIVDSGQVVYRDDWEVEQNQPEAALLTDSVLARFIPQLDEKSGTTTQFYCPHLQNFSCRMADIEFTEKGLVDFIVGRRRLDTPTRLNRVLVRFNMPQLMDVMKEVREKEVDLDGFSALVRYNELHTFRPLDESLERLPPEDYMVVSDFWTPPNGPEWWD